MNKLDKRMTVTINVYGEEVKITAPAWLLNDISLAYDYSSQFHNDRGAPDVVVDQAKDVGHQLYLALKDKGLYA